MCIIFNVSAKREFIKFRSDWFMCFLCVFFFAFCVIDDWFELEEERIEMDFRLWDLIFKWVIKRVSGAEAIRKKWVNYAIAKKVICML